MQGATTVPPPPGAGNRSAGSAVASRAIARRTTAAASVESRARSRAQQAVAFGPGRRGKQGFEELADDAEREVAFDLGASALGTRSPAAAARSRAEAKAVAR
jgi:hypothetical protein